MCNVCASLRPYQPGCTFTDAAAADATQAAAAVAATKPTATLDQMALQLTNGFWQSNFESPRAFSVAPGGTLTVNILGLNAEGKTLARAALDGWSAVTGITFREVFGSAQIKFDDSDQGAYSTSTVSGSRIVSSFVNIATDWLDYSGATLDSYSMMTYLHEIGHALGLGHAGNYNGDATWGTDNRYENDSWNLTVMSYFSQDDNPSNPASYAFAVTPMQADIIAVQNLYGTTTTTRTGDTVYGENTNVDGYLGDLMRHMTGQAAANPGVYYGDAVTLTIFDSGGIDTLDFRSAGVGQNIDLRSEAFSSVLGLIKNVMIARGTVIENARTSSGNDYLIGNDADNKLWGGKGIDNMVGGIGNDTLDGGGAPDTLDGGAGLDTVSFGSAASAVVLDLSKKVSRVGDSQGDTYIDIERFSGSRFDDLFYGNVLANMLSGSAGNDRIYGNAGNDTLKGDSGDDTIVGNSGADVLAGGTGRDRFVFLSAADSITGARDIITDFEIGLDQMQVGWFDANTSLAGSQGFDFIGSAAFSSAGQLRFQIDAANNRTLVQGDIDGNGQADFLVQLSGTLALSGADFLL